MVKKEQSRGITEQGSNVKLLDCTLRDGGYVNDFNFGKANINKIINTIAMVKIIMSLGVGPSLRS